MKNTTARGALPDANIPPHGMGSRGPTACSGASCSPERAPTGDRYLVERRGRDQSAVRGAERAAALRRPWLISGKSANPARHNRL